MKDLFIKTAQQKYWLDQLASIAEPIKAEAKEVEKAAEVVEAADATEAGE